MARSAIFDPAHDVASNAYSCASHACSRLTGFRAEERTMSFLLPFSYWLLRVGDCERMSVGLHDVCACICVCVHALVLACVLVGVGVCMGVWVSVQ